MCRGLHERVEKFTHAEITDHQSRKLDDSIILCLKDFHNQVKRTTENTLIHCINTMATLHAPSHCHRQCGLLNYIPLSSLSSFNQADSFPPQQKSGKAKKERAWKILVTMLDTNGISWTWILNQWLGLPSHVHAAMYCTYECEYMCVYMWGTSFSTHKMNFTPRR